MIYTRQLHIFVFYCFHNSLTGGVGTGSILLRLLLLFEKQLKLMKGKALRKHGLHEKTAASVLLKLFISGNE